MCEFKNTVNGLAMKMCESKPRENKPVHSTLCTSELSELYLCLGVGLYNDNEITNDCVDKGRCTI